MFTLMTLNKLMPTVLLTVFLSHWKWLKYFQSFFKDVFDIFDKHNMDRKRSEVGGGKIFQIEITAEILHSYKDSFLNYITESLCGSNLPSELNSLYD